MRKASKTALEAAKSGIQKRPGETTSGVYTWLRSGKINPSVRGHRRLQKYLADVRKDVISDLGGRDNMTALQEILVESTIQAYGYALLAATYTRKYSILRPDSARKGILELQPVLGQQFLSFLNTVRQNAVVLGLDRKKIDDTLSLDRYVQARDAEKAAASAQVDADKPTTEPKEGPLSREGQGTAGKNSKDDSPPAEIKARPTSTSSEKQGSEGKGQ
jgi:hypothetical protein